MKTSNAEFEVKISGGRIVDATVLENGTCKLTVEMNEIEKTDAVVKEKNVPDENAFVLLEASKLSLKDEFMQYEPTTNNQRKLKESLTEAIESGLSDFWASRLDPSFNEDETGLVFEVDRKPAVGKSYNWWEEKARQYLPERGSHLGTKSEYVAFLGVLIKKLIASGLRVSSAWNAVCDDSKELGHYWNSENAKHDFEVTGSRNICGFCDLANTYKILAWDKEAGGFWLAGGDYFDNSFNSPLSDLGRDTRQGNCDHGSVGWLVLSK